MTTRNAVELGGDGWKLWRDTEASWREDTLHLPPVDVTGLPVNPPTGGWQALDGRGASVSVPGTVEQSCWNEFGDYQGVSWWWRTLNVPAVGPGQRCLLQFDAVRMRAEVFLNEQLVGYDLVGNTPFEIDVTDHVRPGATNALAVRVTDPNGNFSWEDFDVFRWGRYTTPPSHGFGGITGPVRLLIVDAVHIADVFIKNKPPVNEIDIEITLRNTGGQAVQHDVHVQIAEVDRPGQAIYEHVIVGVELPPGEHVITHTAHVDNPKHWHVDHPHLHVCRVSLPAGDEHAVRFGFRWFAPEGIGERAVFRLNGWRIVLRSAISWGFWPITGSVPSPTLVEKNMAAAKALGLNMCHFHRGMAQPLLLDAADEAGLLYYAEPGGYWCRGGDEFSYAWARAQFLRMVRRDRNHPSLAIYNLVNEADRPPHVRVERDMVDARALDPTRTITFTSGWNRAGAEDATKLHVRPYDEQLHISGWCDEHHAAGPGVYRDAFYKGRNEYRLHTTNIREIVFWGEEGAIGTPPLLGSIARALEKQSDGWDGADYRAWHDAYAQAFEKKAWGKFFRTVDELIRRCAQIAYYYQGRIIENARLGNSTDGYVINGWESQKWENHSGLVDCFRNLKGDPAILAHYNQPLYIAVKLHEKVGRPPVQLYADFHIINERNLHGDFTLHMWLEDERGHELWSEERTVPVSGGETFGELLAADVNIQADAGAGRYTLRAVLRGADGQDAATGFDEAFLVDWQPGDLPLNGVLLGDGTAGRKFIADQTEFELPLWSPHASELDYVLAEGYDPYPRAIVPKECLVPAEGHRGGLLGEYFRGRDFDAAALKRVDATLDFEWTDGPDSAVGASDYSVRWTGWLVPPESGPYTFYLTHDDGARLWVDGQALVDEWTDYETWSAARCLTQTSREIELEAGRRYEIRVEFYQKPGRGLIRLAWTTPGAMQGAHETGRALLRRVSEHGTTALLMDHAASWARFLDQEGLVQYRGWLQGGLYWLGSNFFVREHPLFAGLPVNQGLNWEYQELARYEADRHGLLIDGEEAVVGMVSGHHHAIATAVGVIPHGKGRIVLSTLDLKRSLNTATGTADMVRKLFCNFLMQARRKTR